MDNSANNHGHRREKRRATKFTPTGNEILSIGQRDWFRITDIKFYTKPFISRKSRAYRFFLFCMRICIYACKTKKTISVSWAASIKPFFFTIKNGTKKEAAKLSLGRLFYLTVLNKKKKLVKA